jgi:hypothetical protein
LVHRARYVNHSWVFWSGQGDFLRVDFETELRWRIFPVLPARTILESRQRRGNFFVPHPAHESAVLFAQAVWVGELSGRYRSKLARLYEACADKDELRGIYREAFGGAGRELAEFHAQVLERPFDAAFCARLKRSLAWKWIARPGEWVQLAANALDDAGRGWQRLRQPPGISLLYVSTVGHDERLNGTLRRMEFLFPAQKCVVLKSPDWRQRPGLKTAWKRLKTLFKGGMFVEFSRSAADAELPEAMTADEVGLYVARRFVCAEDSRGRCRLSHPHSGCQAATREGSEAGETEFTALLIGFIATVLEREQGPAAANGSDN